MILEKCPTKEITITPKLYLCDARYVTDMGVMGAKGDDDDGIG